MSIVRLNAINVRTLPPAGGARAEYRDELVRGLVLRVSPTGARSYAITYSRRHRNYRYTLGTTERLPLEQARSEAKRLLARITLGEHPAEVRARERRAELTVGALVDEALAARKTLVLRPSTRRQWTWVAKKLIKPHLEREPAASLKRQRIRAWGEKLAQSSAYNAHAAFRVLRRVYSWAVQHDKLEASPFVQLLAPGLSEIASSDRVLSADELRALLLALDHEEIRGQYADATLLLLLTMVRREALLGARLVELELQGDAPRWLVPAERNKVDVPHLVPLAPAAVDVFERQIHRARGGAVFPPARASKKSSMQWSSRWVRRLKARMERIARREIPRWTIHDLRRTAATHMREHLGVDRDVVRLLLGHTTGLGVTAVYDRAERLTERRRALEAWAGYLAALRVNGAAEAPSGERTGSARRPDGRRRASRA